MFPINGDFDEAYKMQTHPLYVSLLAINLIMKETHIAKETKTDTDYYI